MKKLKFPSDDFLRESLGNHQMIPSAAAKQAFMRDVAMLPLTEKKNRKGWYIAGALLLICSLSILIWAVMSGDSSILPNSKVGNAYPKTIAEELHTNPPAISQSTGSVAATTSNSTVSKHENINTPSLKTPQDQVAEPVSKPIVPVPAESENKASSAVTEAQPPITNDTPKSASSSPYIEKPPELQQLPRDTVPAVKDSVLTSENEKKGKNSDKALKNRKWSPGIGVYYIPEWMFNTLEGTKFVNNFGLEGIFQFGKFSVRTGAGLSIAKGSNELVVAYNDYLGNYNHLDSMQFTWNTPEQQFIPKFFMSSQTVYDTLMKYDHHQVVKRYTYLQIPMIMGYDFWQSERVSIGIRVGPVMSVLIGTKQLSAAYEPGNKKVISMNDIAPGQVSLNWQVMGGIGATIRLSKDIRLDLEPSVRYYFNSVYEKPVNNAKPWSVGIRVALINIF